jgi:hypothetical protein
MSVNPARPQDSKCFREQLILQPIRGDVMKHGEAHHRGERGIGQPGIAAIAVNHPRPVAVQPVQPLGDRLIDFDCCDRVRPLDECPQSRAVTGPDFKGLVAQLDIGKRPRQQLISDHVGPTHRATPSLMQQVHRHDVAPFCWKLHAFRTLRDTDDCWLPKICLALSKSRHDTFVRQRAVEARSAAYW